MRTTSPCLISYGSICLSVMLEIIARLVAVSIFQSTDFHISAYVAYF